MTGGKRRTAREMAVQMLYQSDLGGSPLPHIFSTFDLADYHGGGDLARQRRRVEDAFEYAQALVRGTIDHREEIDAMIRGQADNWRLERMPPVDRNILRLAIYEMLYEQDTPKLVVVDEAIELAKKFGGDESGQFVNGILDAVRKGLGGSEETAPDPAG